MGGINPYLQPAANAPARRRYRVTFVAESRRVEVGVEPEKIPYGRDGLPGSLLDIGLAHGVPIDHACGGVCACSTCHVIVREGLESCPPASDAEEDQLDNAPALTPQSRLGCQCVPDGSRDLVVEVPSWNRNLAREQGH